MFDKRRLYQEVEPDMDQTISNFVNSLESLKSISNIYKAYQDNDEIQFFQYTSKIDQSTEDTDGYLANSIRPGGSSFFSEKMALLKCFGETVERVSTQTYLKKWQVRGSYNELKQKAINPNKICIFSKKQLKDTFFHEYVVTDDSLFAWSNAVSLNDSREILIPTQMFYYTYRHEIGEQKISPLISTGAAGGSCLASAIVRGIMEIVERDSFMIFYLNKMSGKKIKITSIRDDRVTQIINKCNRYKLTWHAIDVTSDLGIPSFVSILIDKTGVGPSVSVGLKSDYYALNAVLGSFEECLHPRNFARRLREDTKTEDIYTSTVTTIRDRALLWHDKKMIRHLNFWLKQKEVGFNNETNVENISHGEILAQLEKILNKNHLECYIKDITTPIVKKIPYFVVKVIIPGLQPIYLNEEFPFLGGKRLHEVPKKLGYKIPMKLNKIPHPFL